MWINKDNVIYARIKPAYQGTVIKLYYVDAVVGITASGVLDREIFSAKTEEECKQFLNKLGLIENKL